MRYLRVNPKVDYIIISIILIIKGVVFSNKTLSEHQTDVYKYICSNNLTITTQL